MKKTIFITNRIGYTLLIVNIQLTPEVKRHNFTLVNIQKTIHAAFLPDRTINQQSFALHKKKDNCSYFLVNKEGVHLLSHGAQVVNQYR